MWGARGKTLSTPQLLSHKKFSNQRGEGTELGRRGGRPVATTAVRQMDINLCPSWEELTIRGEVRKFTDRGPRRPLVGDCSNH